MARKKKSDIKLTEEQIGLLGKISDREVADRIGCCSSFKIRSIRISLGIQPHQGKVTDINWTEEMIARLGTDFDKVLAQEWGISPASVCNKRRELKIPPVPSKRTTGRIVEKIG